LRPLTILAALPFFTGVILDTVELRRREPACRQWGNSQAIEVVPIGWRAGHALMRADDSLLRGPVRARPSARWFSKLTLSNSVSSFTVAWNRCVVRAARRGSGAWSWRSTHHEAAGLILDQRQRPFSSKNS
jgi:hypothetical protein